MWKKKENREVNRNDSDKNPILMNDIIIERWKIRFALQ